MSLSAGNAQQTSSQDLSGKDQEVHMAIWGSVCDKFCREFGQNAYDTWVSHLIFSSFEGGVVSLAAPTRFVRDYIQSHYATRLNDFFKADLVGMHELVIRLDSSLQSKHREEQAESKADAQSGDSAVVTSANFEGSALDQRYTFDSFVVGKSNELAYAAAKRIAESDEIAFNPLFIHGGVGLGKTHLMHAIAHEIRRKAPQKKVVYVSAEKFMLEFIAALRFKDTHAFKQKFRNVDILMVDDVQFIANKDSTQEEFFHTFNALVDNRCQLIITADRSPTELEGIEERIVSRLGWGLVADIHPTDYELRLGILQSKAEANDKVIVPQDVLEFLAKRITSNVRHLEGALTRVMAFAELVGRPITMEMTRNVLQDLIRANDRKVTIDEIQRTVADYFSIRLSELLSDRRARNIARPRQFAMYLCKQLTNRSLPEIGRKFGGRDHTTVMHAVRKVEELKEQDSQIEDDIGRLMRQLEG
ncbi:chromosomal replication initiator protein DnaA [Temperatibacter marinus]|uniref:Chromosomal replication initiator protein DnaA n=1 Tax=Temperatibacter marinus TaxID=1456591 RepID=A0AA52HBM9_9PROT|nr:chromosomal replication initiator protein DnaA [Temperatibacter marinus]WND03803.1 chromosomal replication initiator protein DnaA [Temperatibacter marinus]